MFGIALIIVIAWGFMKLSNQQFLTKNIDLLTIQFPLSLYYSDNGRYPEGLEDLVPKYTESLPQPFTSSFTYTYTLSNEGKSYTLCVVKETKEKECVKR